jgi:hypothetical protein
VEALDEEIIEAILNTAQHPVGGHCELKIEFMTGAVTEVHFTYVEGGKGGGKGGRSYRAEISLAVLNTTRPRNQ